MASFNAKAFEKKLKDMDLSQTSVQTVSLWIIHHRQNIKEILSVWIEQMKKVKSDRKMVLFYLANDVVQNSRKKSKELVQFFGKAFKEILPYLNDKKINGQVERVFKIWEERRVYEKEYLEKFRSLHSAGKKDKTKNGEEKTVPKHADKPSSKQADKPAEKSVKPKIVSRPLPPDFKMSTVMNMIVSMKELESEISKQDSQMASLRVDASDLEAVKQVKDRSGVNKFVKEFEESKEKLDVHCNTMSRCINDKRALIDMLYNSESYYDAAYEEAKVIVHAYKTFGSRLSSMKRKVESRVKKLESAWKKKQKEIEEKKASQPEYELEPISDAEEPNEFQPIGDLVKSGLDSLSRRKKDELYNPEDPTLDNVKVLDMDLESDSDQETPNGPLYDPSSVLYDPSEIDATVPQTGASADSQQGGVTQINIPNPEDVFKNLVGQSDAVAATTNQFVTSSSMANEMPGAVTFPQLGNMSVAQFQPGVSNEGTSKFAVSQDLTSNSQKLAQLQAQTRSISASSSTLVATEPSRTLLSDAAMSPISDDSCPSPSPEGTPEGLFLEEEASSNDTNQLTLMPANTFPNLLPTTPLLPNPAIGSQFAGGEQLVTVAPDNWPSISASHQLPLDQFPLPNLQPGSNLQLSGIADWSLPANLQLPDLPTVSLPASLGLGMPFPLAASTNELSAQNHIFNQSTAASSDNMLLPGVQIPLSVSQPLLATSLPVVSEISTPTQDESPGKSIRPMDILSQLLSKGKKSKEDEDEAVDNMKRPHSRSSRKSSSGKRRSSHRHHGSEHRESSQEHDSAHGSSRSKDRSHSSRRRSRSHSTTGKDEASSLDSSLDLRDDSVSSFADSMSEKSPKIPRLNSINENESLSEDRKEDVVDFGAQQLKELSTGHNVEVPENRQQTIFDLRRSNASASIGKPHDQPSEWPIRNNTANQFARTEPVATGVADVEAGGVTLANAAEGLNSGPNQLSSQLTYQASNADNAGLAHVNVSSQAELPIISSGPTTAQSVPAYYYNTRRSPTPELDMPQPGDGSLQQPQFVQNPISQSNKLESTLPIPMFALEFKQELDQGLYAPVNHQVFQTQNFEQQPIMQPQNPLIHVEHPILMQNRPPMQTGGPMQPEGLMPIPDHQAFRPERPQFQEEQRIFMPEHMTINQERPQSNEPEFHPGVDDFRPDTSFLPADRPLLHQEEAVVRPNHPLLRPERSSFHSERPMFRGQRPMLRQQGPRFHDESQFHMAGQQDGARGSPGFQRQRSFDDFQSQRNSFDEQVSEYDTNYDSDMKRDFHPQMINQETESSFSNDMGHPRHFAYENEEDFEQNMVEDERALNGFAPSHNNLNNIMNRHERPGRFQHGYPRGAIMRPRGDQGRGRYRSQGPNTFPRGNRPPHPRMGNFRPRFRPPLRPRLPQGYSPRRPVF